MKKVWPAQEAKVIHARCAGETWRWQYKTELGGDEWLFSEVRLIEMGFGEMGRYHPQGDVGCTYVIIQHAS